MQARTWSTRLPKKIYLPIGKYSILEHVYRACNDAALTLLEQTKGLQRTVVLILGPEKDELLKEYCEDKKLPWYGGDEHDLFNRYSKALHEYGCDAMIRVTSDCWNIETKNIVDIAKALLIHDYASNVIVRSLPEGQDCQGARTKAFDWIDHKTKHNREHPFYEFDNNLDFRRRFVSAGFSWANCGDLSNRIFEQNSIDTREDYEKSLRTYREMQRTNDKGAGARVPSDQQQEAIRIY